MNNVNAFLTHLMEGQILATILVSLLSAGAVILAIRRSLTPLERLAEEADALPVQSLDRRFSEQDLPAELQPIVRRLNDLLSRIGEAFSRERRFTSNVAHELRTPIAELRTLAEVAIACPRAAPQDCQEFQETLAIARQMQTLVESLLTIARAESLPVAAHTQREDMESIVRAALKPYHSAISERRLLLRCDLVSGVILTDRALLESLLRNLISNAVTYAPPDSEFIIHGEVVRECPLIVISNQAPALSQEDLVHLAEPFWRKDAVRSGGEHAGLGFSLAVAYARLLGLTIAPRITGGVLTIQVAPSVETAPL